jgi:hypothetical protein
MNKNQIDPKSLGEKYLMEVLVSDDPDFLRSMVLEMMVVLGHVYKKVQLHLMLHPVFFFAGFLTCHFLTK